MDNLSQSLKDPTGISEKNKEQRTKEVCPKTNELTIACGQQNSKLYMHSRIWHAIVWPILIIHQPAKDKKFPILSK